MACFAGYRVFRIVLGVYGFILGALMASSAMGADQTWHMVVGALVGGLIGAVILLLAYFVGVALIGGALGALVANVIWAAAGREPGLIVVIIFAVAGALGALALQRYVIIVATAFGGAQTAIVGAAALVANRAVDAASSHGAYRVYPIDPFPGTRMDVIAWIVLGALGLVVQLKLKSKRK